MPSRPWVPKFLKDLLDVSPSVPSANNKFMRWKSDGSGPEFVDVTTITTPTGEKLYPSLTGPDADGNYTISWRVL